MRTTATVAQMLVRLTGLAQLALGLVFWTGNLTGLVPVHILVGLLLVLSLWTLAFVGARSGVPPGMVVLVALWGLLLPVLGLSQASVLPGGAHWVVQALHLLVGLAAIGLGEMLGARIRRGSGAAVAA